MCTVKHRNTSEMKSEVAEEQLWKKVKGFFFPVWYLFFEKYYANVVCHTHTMHMSVLIWRIFRNTG